MPISFQEGLCPVCGKEHRSKVQHILTGKGAVEKLAPILREKKIRKIFLLCDCNTEAVGGDRVKKLLAEADIAFTLYRLPDKAKPEEKTVGGVLMHFDPTCDAVLSIGSGVIHDTGKILAHRTGRYYIIVATAPSMDGYASETSSMEVAGLKASLPSKCPEVIVGDTDILKTAPDEMLSAGLGDMMAKYISICEWRISHLICGEYYCEAIADLIRGAVKKCADNAEGLLKREDAAVDAVFEGLVLGGLAMSYAGMSRPASGVEHYFSHVWDMRGLEFGTPTSFHGTQCAVGTLLAAQLYEKVKAITPDGEKALASVQKFQVEEWNKTLLSFLGRSGETMILQEEKEGKYDLKKHANRLPIILNNWDKICAIIEEEIPSCQTLEALLETARLPKKAEEMGIDPKTVPTTFFATKDIRDKYVLSRLCWDLGILEEMAEILKGAKK
jgi:glycerol-1-phosphate dehydrogenase [NAD(P)+]